MKIKNLIKHNEYLELYKKKQEEEMIDDINRKKECYYCSSCDKLLTKAHEVAQIMQDNVKTCPYCGLGLTYN